MDQWLDSLSEDWVSQPRSPHSSPALKGSVLRDGPSPSSNASQSRIPRYKPRSVSDMSTTSGKELGRSLSTRKSSLVENALREKTSSNINASPNRQCQRQVKPQLPKAGSIRPRERQASTQSLPSIPQDTVQYKSSPAKEKAAHGTPEWKRRVLKENAGGDLFSPKQLGLESVFKPPTVNSKSQVKITGKRKVFVGNEIPSSPPPYPTLPRQRPNAPATDPKKLATAPDPRGESPTGTPVADEIGQDARGHLSPAESRGNGDISQVDIRKPSTPLGRPKSNQSKSPLRPPQSHLPASMDQKPRVASVEMDQSGVFSDKPRNEDISPFYVSRHNTVDGRVEYAAIDLSMRRLRSQMDKMRLQQQNLPSSRSSDHGVDYAESRPAEDSRLQERMDDITSQSLPDDLSMGTDAFAAHGGFVSIRRGGYSNDGSFQRRPVSPSLLPDLDGPSLRVSSSTNTHQGSPVELPRNFSQTKSRTPSSPPHSSTPRTPRHQKNESTDSNDRPRSSGSPLKLFDKYDTFTAEKLVRRMSKFEETIPNELSGNVNADSGNDLPSSPSPRRRRTFKQSQTEASVKALPGRRISSFGDGELNDHEFPLRPGLYQDQVFDKAHQHGSSEQSSQRQGNGFRSQRKISYRSETETISKAKSSSDRRRSDKTNCQLDEWNESDIERPRKEPSAGYSTQDAYCRGETVQTATGKRLPYSPAKDPAPKRRRTLRDSEELDQLHINLQEHIAAWQPPVSSGRKRKDALYDSDRQAADPNTLARRQIRQPKVPTPSRTSVSITANGYETTAVATVDRVFEESPAIDPPTQIVAGALATVALNTAKEVTYGSRKASVTTADFFNEAQQIMQLIRAKGRPRSSHTTTEGSEAGHPTIAEESVIYDSTKDDFSRPPSREGSHHGLKPPAKSNARVISHLRKFEDDQDLGLALSSSLKTLKISQSRRESRSSAPAHGEAIDAHSGAESDPPNIRIRESNAQVHMRKHSSSTHEFLTYEAEEQVRSQASQSTSGPSSGRSNPTGSSHSSTNRMVIAPETVAHLLSDQMAGMVFDRQKQLWVKRKSSPNVGGFENLDQQSEGTEEDLFGDIPDLTINEMEELQMVKEAVSSVKTMGSPKDKVSVCDQAVFKETQRKALQSEQTHDGRPRTAEGKSIPMLDDSSAPSKFSHFASSGPHPGTRATSWGDDAFSSKEPLLPKHPDAAVPDSAGDQHEEQVEHEISIFEGRESRTPKYQINRNRQARVVTVAFSSPLVDQREPEYGLDGDFESGEDESELNLDDSPVKFVPRQEASAKRPTSSGSGRHSGSHATSRRMSLANQSHLARPMSRLDEEDEMSMVHCSIKNRHMTMELAISTPLPMSRSLMVPPTTGQRSSIGFHLSPLPDFTVHQIDKPVDGVDGQVAKWLPTRDIDNRLSLSAQDLVKNLTDLEPYEPYWDYIRSVDLHDRDLTTLHMLDDFCGRVEELDVSENQIEGLNGIPRTVRQLNIRGNCLSDLAAWDSLQNLQYLDVSGNQLVGLRGFQHLIHLRSLKADNNEIENLNGLEDLNGLIKLSLRGNRLREIDFEDFDMYDFARVFQRSFC